MSILAAILILSASGHAERSMESDETIAGIAAQCAWGAVNDVAATATGSCGSRLERLAKLEASRVRLAVDGQPRTGLRAWGEAAWRVGGYVADVRTAGSVDIACRLRLGRRTVVTSTAVSDGRVEKVIDAWWTETVQVTKRITRRIPIHVTITIRASEIEAGTVLVGTATGFADTSEFRCGLIRRIAERQAAEQLAVGLPEALRRIEAGGRQFYAGGSDIADALDTVRIGIRFFGGSRR